MYDFDTFVDRSGTYSLKWEVGSGNDSFLPMWVADMDFRTAPKITEALVRRAEHGIFGYTDIPEEWYDAYIDRWDRRHGIRFGKNDLIFATGVIPILSSCVRKLTAPAENVVILTPVYNVFFNCIRNNGRNVLSVPLIYRDTEYGIDFEKLETALADPQTTLMMFCNPHNPVGKIWDSETIERVGELAYKYGVIVISDEIHCDITDPGCDYIPFASVSEHCRMNSITCISPTKTFNLAGIQTSAAAVPNSQLRGRVYRALNNDECGEPNAFAVQAAVTAFTECEDWLCELREYIYRNKQTVKAFIVSELPQIKLVPSQATYLLWLDCSAVTKDSRRLSRYIRRETGLFLSPGDQYGTGGEGFLRMNIACPKTMVEDGLQRLKKAVSEYTE